MAIKPVDTDDHCDVIAEFLYSNLRTMEGYCVMDYHDKRVLAEMLKSLVKAIKHEVHSG